ncbi:hypothetical protein CYLTODRAFT_447940 [Cylindrobasidium torrendii FP15055 ss-10]|uniref:Uncharacterized protein n=1 Tax=Cylindrobasidium torrendii FP15055 ss-10 TaxID=1314674 RepID=A0A0D7ARZ1_9AGAR|nr:hypothetical protein CYLTODRAFT_447940 [Cylindrobasidium torrendii FP15055 ss-10]
MTALPKGTGAAERPKILSSWMQKGYLKKTKGGLDATHANMLVLEPENLKTHVQSFNAWWKFLQPEWREETAVEAYTGSDFGVLNTRGQTGWILIVACLWWWGTTLAGAEDSSTQAKGDWRKALTDTLKMLRLDSVSYQEYMLIPKACASHFGVWLFWYSAKKG